MIKTTFIAAVCLAGATTLSSQVNLTSSLTACYSLNGNAIDGVNALNGTLTGVSAAADQFNTPNSALAFAGTTASYVELPNSSLLKPSNAVTIAGWFKPTALNTFRQLVFTKNIYTNFFAAYSLAFNYSNGGYKFHCGRSNGSVDDVVTGTTNIVVNTWYHVAMSIDNSAMKIYVNGVLENSITPTFSGFNYDATRKVILGGTNESNWNQPYAGLMDNLRFYSRALSGAEITALYSQNPGCPTSVAPTASFAATPLQLCPGGSLTLTDLSSNGPTSWSWLIAGPQTFTSGLYSPTLALNSPGIYSVTLVASNSAGTSTALQTVTVMPGPTVNIVSNLNPACFGEVVTLSASGASTYTWNNSGTGSTQSFTAGTTSSYTVTGTGSNGCSSSATITQTVLPLPVVSVSPQNIQVCSGSQVLFSASGATSYTWSNLQTGPAILMTPSSGGTYTVTGLNSFGCSAAAGFTISVLSTPTISVVPSLAVSCPGQTITFAGGGANSYTWSTLASAPVITVAPLATTLYTVSGTAANGCTATAAHMQQVEPFPVVTVLATSATVCIGKPVTLAAAGAASYTWSTGQQLSQITVTPQGLTGYTVTGSSAIANCKSTAIMQVTASLCTGLEEQLQIPVSVFPNPFTSELNVHTGIEWEGRVVVTDLAGRIVASSTYAGEQLRLDLGGLSAGVYFLELFDGNYRMVVHKIIKAAE
jgi:PKD repeat protein